MTSIPRGPRRPVKMSLSEDLVKDARAPTPSRSESDKARLEERERRIDATIAFFAKHQAEHGIWGEEFDPL